MHHHELSILEKQIVQKHYQLYFFHTKLVENYSTPKGTFVCSQETFHMLMHTLMYIQCTFTNILTLLFFFIKIANIFYSVSITPSNDFFPLETRLQIWSSLQGTCQVVFVYLCNVLLREAAGLFDSPRVQNCHPWQSIWYVLSECVWMHFNSTHIISSLILSQELHFTDTSALSNAIWY